MNIDQIINYVFTTLHNVNPAILRQMLEEYVDGIDGGANIVGNAIVGEAIVG